MMEKEHTTYMRLKLHEALYTYMTPQERPFLHNAGGKDNLILERDEARAYVTQTKSDWAQHIQEIHKGYPATTCHRCMTYKQGIQSNEKFIEVANQELEGLD